MFLSEALDRTGHVHYDRMEPGMNLVNSPGQDETDTSIPYMVDADGEILNCISHHIHFHHPMMVSVTGHIMSVLHPNQSAPDFSRTG